MTCMISGIKKKVFGIGFHKTATSSLAEALRELGYSVTGPNGVNNPNIAKEAFDIAKSLVSKFDAFQDNPWPILYRELDQSYPNSKFILTIRSSEDWIKSVVRHFGGEVTPMREWIYGVGNPISNEHIYLSTYNRHNREVLAYFQNRSNDLLVLAITEGDGWEKLCPFLGEKIPNTPFPCKNQAGARERWEKKRGKFLWKKYYLFRRQLNKRLGSK